MLEDSYGRKIDYLRLSVTERCNLRCSYCIPALREPSLGPGQLLRYDEMLYLVDIFAGLGIKKIRVTGGEPLLYGRVVALLKALKAQEGIESVTLTTNGILLDKVLPVLKDLGIDSINISLDSVSASKYMEITGLDCSGQVLKNIRKAVEMGFKMIKVNTVLSPMISDADILEMVRRFEDDPIVLRFIEMMPSSALIGTECQSSFCQEPGYPWKSRMDALIRSLGTYKPTQKTYGFGPAKYYRSSQRPLVIGMIANHDAACSFCNRLRLTSSGKMVLCIFSGKSLDLKQSLRQNKDRKQLEEEIRRFIKKKPKNRTLASQGKFENCLNDCMYKIGG